MRDRHSKEQLLLSLTPMHSLRHRLVRSRQSAHEDVCASDFFEILIFEISKNGERVSMSVRGLAVRLGDVWVTLVKM